MTTILPSVLPSSVSKITERGVVLHGWGQSAAYWQPLARHLAQSGISLFCPCMPTLASMSSAPQGSAERLQQIVEQLTVSALASDITLILAHSAGAPAGVLLAERLNLPLVLIEPLPNQLGLSSQSKLNLLISTEYKGLLMDRLKQQYPFAQPGTLNTIAAALPDETSKNELILNAPAFERGLLVRTSLEKMHKKVTVVRGGRSAFLNEKDIKVILAAIPHAKTVVISSAGHSPHVDAPNQLLKVINEILL